MPRDFETLRQHKWKLENFKERQARSSRKTLIAGATSRCCMLGSHSGETDCPETSAARSDSLVGCRVSSFLAHSLKKEHTVIPYPLRLVISCELNMTTNRVCWSRRKKKRDLQKHVWEGKARHTPRQDPAGSRVDKAYRCTGSFLSC